MKRLLFALLAASLASCEGGQGHRGPCATATGPFVDCETEPLETAEDACWKLVECGVIPLDDPDDDLGWARCVREIEDLPTDRRELVIACVEVAHCDDLLLNNSPDTSYDERLCLEFGDQG